MAQRTIHYLFGEMISNQVRLTDKKRFLLGSILPDAVEPCHKAASHFKVKTDTLTYLDFEAFRNRYFHLMQCDDFYLGYYMHLVEDAFYRAFIYQDRFTMPNTKEEVALLHNDYHILNSYIIHKYKIRNILTQDLDWKNEAIEDIASFLVPDSLEKLSYEFQEQTTGSTVFLTENMLDEFVAVYVPIAIAEVTSIRHGISLLNVQDYTWLRNRLK